MALGVLDFIDADSVDLTQFPVFESPGDDMFDRIKNLPRQGNLWVRGELWRAD